MNASRRVERRGFTLVELLTVIGIMALLVGLSGPALQALTGAGTINREIGDLSGVLESARAYAMANHTYVRVGLAQMSPTAAHPTPSVAVLVIYSADGQLDATEDTATAMANPVYWPTVRTPIVLDNLVFSDSLNGVTPNTRADVYPSQSDISSLSRPTSQFPSGVTFSAYVQFEPSGEARVVKSTVARNIKIALDKPSSQGGKNPFILRLSGMNGTVIVIRKEGM